jgi:transcriptional regulator with XRE-family HTH domain
MFGMSISEASLRSSLSEGYWQAIEEGTIKQPTDTELRNIGKVFNITNDRPEAIITLLSLEISDIPKEKKDIMWHLEIPIKDLTWELIEGLAEEYKKTKK